MIIVTLLATLAAAMVWQHWRAVQVESAERDRVQATWILSGALDFAKLILREDAKSGRATALTEPWATPLAESRVSSFMAADRSNAEGGPPAFLSGYITDAQSRYNLTNLVSAGKVAPLELETLERLCQAIGVDGSVAARIANGLRDAITSTTRSGSNAAAPLLPRTVQQLTWLGIDAASVSALQPYVVLLPFATPVNVNTASREVLTAAIQGMDPSSADRLIRLSQRTPFKDMVSFNAQVQSFAPIKANLDVRSSFFVVHGRLRISDRVLAERSLVQRHGTRDITVLWHERLAGLEPAPAH